MMRSCLLLLVALPLTAQPPRFHAVTVTDQLKFGYQLTVCDVNQDERPDLIVVDERSTELAWFENPGADAVWTRHLLARDVPRTINLVCSPGEIILGHHFESAPARSRGTVLRLTPGDDVRQPWQAREIDQVPTIHRLRWANTRTGRLLLVSPMLGLEAEPPAFASPTPVYAHRPGEWKRLPLFDGLTGIVHSVHPMDWDGDGHDEIVTSSFGGIHLLKEHPEGVWTARRLSPGDPRECPLCGSSEVRAGHIHGRRFLAAIEPWHGNQLVVYPDPEAALHGRPVERLVLDDKMLNGHALAVGDFTGDGRDEIVVGFRGKGFHLSLYQAADDTGRNWTRHLLDDTIAAADCQIADLNGDRRPDLACSGASTGNVRVYLNTGN
ncbi:MAG: VCBS repeat-containing protein [Bryobacteraceae bacterium]|nr:VCBS repeat-containing protein [Bryobacteraceae bacterium]